MLSARRPAAWRLRKAAISLRSASRTYASITDLSKFPKPGERLHGFTLQRAQHIPELELTAVHLLHDTTGADYLHVARDDSNNVFSIGFKTNPPDATGVPHILEHTTLCGSEKYPVRDPFFKMLPRSLSNFMNAFTSTDHTTYPFATTNAQDFRNLMSVYLDATLRPLLNANDFTQEGWRIGPENPLAAKDGSSAGSKLVFKGVVYNEMKGQMSDASYLYYIRFHEHLIPSLHNSGGDPQKITDLTHKQLKEFHAAHYHPSNAKIFTYGDMSLEEHAKYIGEQLSSFSKISTDHDIKQPIDLSAGPQEVTVSGPTDPLIPAEAQYKTSVTWVVNETEDMVERFSLSILTSLLLDGYGSPFYKLIENGLGSDFTPNTGFSPNGMGATFSVGLTGVEKDAVPRVKEAIMETLKETRTNGFEAIKIEGILHQLEISLKRKSANFGMGIMSRVEGDWHNGIDPFDALAWQKTVDGFKAKYAQEGYLEGLLEKYMLHGNTLTFTMEPSSTYGTDLAEEEASRLASKIADVTRQFPSEQEAAEHLAKRELELLDAQESARNQDLSCLPTVHVDDIPRAKPEKELRHSQVSKVRVQWREAATNGLTYFRAVHSLPDNLSDELRELIPLFSEALMRLGTKKMSMEKLEEQIKLKTGGVSIGYHSSTSPTSLDGYEEGLVLSGYALDHNVPAMYDLFRTLILDTDFDSPEAEKRIRELISSSASSAMDSVAESGHAYARKHAMSNLTPEGRLREQISGLAQVKLTTRLATYTEPGSLAGIISNLKTLQSIAISNDSSLRTAIICDPDSSSFNERKLANFLSGLPSRVPSVKGDNNTALSMKWKNAKSFFPLPYQVYYSGVALRTVPYTSPQGAPLQVLAQLLTHKHLHHEIREKGGAYGGGAFAQGLGGAFGFYSYRDPNPQNTLKIINGAGKWARDRTWTDRDIEEAKLSVFQSMDAPESVSQEGMTQFLSGIDHTMQQTRREQLLDVSIADVKEAAEKWLVNTEGRSVTVLGERQDWVTEPEWQFGSVKSEKQPDDKSQ
ncbi:putative methionine--tRNA ligase [Venturia nashicola]|uniref:Presequence protease, mitochondrial n=1 Tax=Venturia nashicola TaxID=86259 RepID=A0A4Z1PST6_9PEZI|nr:putative methionine--tRNA ligase [Venturia nashicola]